MRWSYIIIGATLAGCSAPLDLPADLPNAQSVGPARGGPTVTITEELIFLDGMFVQDAVPALVPGNWALPGLEQALVEYRESVDWSVNEEPEHVAKTRVRIAASADTPYIVFKKVLFLLGRIDYSRGSLLVADEAGEIRRLALDWRPCEEWDYSEDTCVTPCVRYGPP